MKLSARRLNCSLWEPEERRNSPVSLIRYTEFLPSKVQVSQSWRVIYGFD